MTMMTIDDMADIVIDIYIVIKHVIYMNLCQWENDFEWMVRLGWVGIGIYSYPILTITIDGTLSIVSEWNAMQWSETTRWAYNTIHSISFNV